MLKSIRDWRDQLTPIQVVKVTSNDTTPLIYLPIEIRRILDIKKGDRLLLYVDSTGRLVAEKVPPVTRLKEDER